MFKFLYINRDMFKNIDKRLRLAIGVIFIIGALFGGLIGYDLRSVGQNIIIYGFVNNCSYMQVLIGFLNH